MNTPGLIPLSSVRSSLPLVGAVIALSLLTSPGANASALNLTDTVTYSGTAVATSSNGFAGTSFSAPESFTLGNAFNDASLTNFPGSIAQGTGDGTGWNFYDDYVFTVGASSIQSALVSFSSAVGGITDLQARIFSTTSPYSSSLATSNLTNPPANGSVVEDSWETMNVGDLYTVNLNATTLAPGTYDLQIRGEVTSNGNGSDSGSYGGSVTFGTVPLPGALPLLMSGLGLFGSALARRRRT